jgi:outer membrane PBP1 activator LpoA protein
VIHSDSRRPAGRGFQARLRTGVLSALLVAAGGGCGPANTRPASQASGPDLRVRQMLADGRHESAAAEFLRLAQLYPNRSVTYTLQAAAAWLDAGNPRNAAALLEKLDVRPPGGNEALHRRLLLARIANTDGRADDALALAESVPAQAAPELRALRQVVLAEAYELDASYLAAARERSALTALPDSARQERADNAQRLWSNLQRAGSAELETAALSADPAFAAWLELAGIHRRLSGSPGALRHAVAAWRNAHPDHPGIRISDTLLAPDRIVQTEPQHIALLLPLTGPFAGAAAAIRDGFLAAWYEQARPGTMVSVYDTNSLNILDRYEEALAAGADFVVGPLERAAVASLAQSGRISATTLALNVTDAAGDFGAAGPGAPQLLQFGLPLEEEARLVARRAYFDGHVRALVISPENDWGRRLSSAFAEEWRTLGGMVVDHASYPPEAFDLSEPVKELFNIDSSDRRIGMLRERLSRGLQAEPRLREDGDMIFMAAVPVAARQIAPQFRYFRAEHIPVYASSHAFTGIHDSQLDADLDGVRFPDMPWVVAPPSSLQSTVNRNWKAESSPFRRLYAFGTDAFRLISALPGIASRNRERLRGESGELYLAEGGRIYRNLPWAQFVNGVPRLLDGPASR